MTKIISLDPGPLVDANGKPVAEPPPKTNPYPFLDKFELGQEFHLKGCVFMVIDKPRVGAGGLLLSYKGPTKSEEKRSKRNDG